MNPFTFLLSSVCVVSAKNILIPHEDLEGSGAAASNYLGKIIDEYVFVGEKTSPTLILQIYRIMITSNTGSGKMNLMIWSIMNTMI